MDILCTKNTNVCKRTGNSFGELIEHFIIGGEETCLIVEADGSMKIIGEFDRKKQEKKVYDCHASCKMYQNGIAGGSNLPTAFVMKGKIVNTGYTYKMLKENGAKHGSTVVMTDNAFMTEEAWLKLTPNIIEGYRAMPFICDNPQWHVIDIFCL